MLDSLFLCSTGKNELLENLQPAWNEKATLPLENKMALLYPEFNVHDIFPWPGDLSESIDIPAFCLSHLIQPSLFLRIRPGYGKAVLSKLSSHSIPFEEINEHGLAVLNTTKLDGIIELDKEAVVQDLNSQKVEELLKQVEWGASARVWDCCAASGGKSMMLYDMKPEIKLTVSDIRENILSNLRKRFAT
ncbi:MAG: Fmu (Sun) protein, partial [Chitinophagaceae bacterium]|nr:Fmu (Sun) protein [Chitinophagaceae bacterium]